MKCKSVSFERIFIIIMWICVICQLIVTLYFNIFEAEMHIGLDSSWEYLKVIVAGQHNSIYPSEFLNETTQPEFERLLLVVPLYKIFGNVFIAYGIANLIVSIICMFLLNKISCSLNMELSQRLIVLNLFLCPFLSNGFNKENDLGYFSCINGFTPYQNILSVAFLLLIYFVVYEGEKKNAYIIGVLTAICMCYVCVSKGLGMLVWAGVPILVYLLVSVLLTGRLSVLIECKSLMLLLILVSMLAGRGIGEVLGFKYLDSDRYSE